MGNNYWLEYERKKRELQQQNILPELYEIKIQNILKQLEDKDSNNEEL